jgi:hypothetical protein
VPELGLGLAVRLVPVDRRRGIHAGGVNEGRGLAYRLLGRHLGPGPCTLIIGDNAKHLALALTPCAPQRVRRRTPRARVCQSSPGAMPQPRTLWQGAQPLPVGKGRVLRARSRGGAGPQAPE